MYAKLILRNVKRSAKGDSSRAVISWEPNMPSRMPAQVQTPPSRKVSAKKSRLMVRSVPACRKPPKAWASPKF